MLRVKKLFVKHLPMSVVNYLRRVRIYKERVSSFLFTIGYTGEKCRSAYLKYKGEPKDVCCTKEVNELIRWGESFVYYRSQSAEHEIPLVWADSPAPGNYGDWLAPYILSKLGAVNIVHHNEAAARNFKHVLSLGSILPAANGYSIVLGAGVASTNDYVDINASFVSVRGPYTAARIVSLGGPKVSNYGDMGFLLPRCYKPKKSGADIDFLIVRHINHVNIKIDLDEGFEETSIFCSHPNDIEAFIDRLHTAKVVATSAMHCFITCIAYGIPAVLFSVGDESNKVIGDGIKYRDALAGVCISEVSPIQIDDLDQFCEIIRSIEPYRDQVDDSTLDALQGSVREALSHFINR